MSEYGKMLLAVDPGDEHVGVAWFDKQEGGWGCVLVQEMTPAEFRQYLGPALNSGVFGTLVVESWSLRRDMAVKLIGSEMETSQMIGMIKYAAWVAVSAFHVPLKLHFQSPKDKAPTFAITARKGYVSTADRLKVPAQHVRDAEIHGIHYVKRTLDEPMLKSCELWDEPPLATQANPTVS